jgi:FeS assembly SUF system protein
MNLEKEIISTLKSIYDPEIPVNIYEMGLIYDIKIKNGGEVKIIMTLTTPNCPVAEILPQEVKKKVELIKKVKNVKIIITFDPPWEYKMMSEEARLELGLI